MAASSIGLSFFTIVTVFLFIDIVLVKISSKLACILLISRMANLHRTLELAEFMVSPFDIDEIDAV